jgi:hypothetical protein
VQGSTTPAIANIPKFNRMISTTAGKNVPIGAEGDRSNPVGMSIQGLGAGACLDIPNSYSAIATAAGYMLTINAGSH